MTLYYENIFCSFVVAVITSFNINFAKQIFNNGFAIPNLVLILVLLFNKKRFKYQIQICIKNIKNQALLLASSKFSKKTLNKLFLAKILIYVIKTYI